MGLVAGIIDRVENRSLGAGRPPMPTIGVVAALRFFRGESMPWPGLRARDDWSGTAGLRQALPS